LIECLRNLKLPKKTPLSDKKRYGRQMSMPSRRQSVRRTARSDTNRSALRKAKIIDSATLLFADRGFDGVSLRDIAEHSGMPLSTLCHHFPAKKDLYDIVVTQAFEVGAKAFLTANNIEGSPEARLRRMFKADIDFLLSGQPEIKLIDRALLDGHVHLDSNPSKIINESRSALKSLFGEMLKTSSVRATWRELSEIYVGISYGVVRMRPMHAQLIAGAVPSIPTRLAELCCSVFLNGISAVK
jgi:AcrR family transcriptional regulator